MIHKMLRPFIVKVSVKVTFPYINMDRFLMNLPFYDEHFMNYVI